MKKNKINTFTYNQNINIKYIEKNNIEITYEEYLLFKKHGLKDTDFNILVTNEYDSSDYSFNFFNKVKNKVKIIHTNY